MLTEAAVYLDAIRTRFDCLEEIINEIGDISELLNWKPAGTEQASIFALIAYVALNADYWIGHLIDGRAEPPGFENALEEARGSDSIVLRQLLQSALETTRLTLNDLKADQLNRTIEYADEIFTPRQCVMQVLDETAARCGEAETLIRWWKNRS
jgi:hypothetical protein